MFAVTVRHRTVYRYVQPVTFGEHRLMLRPRDSHDLRLVRAELILSPVARVRWFHDVFGNSVAIASFDAAGGELVVESVLDLDRYPRDPQTLALDETARTYPFVYSSEDRADLGRLLDPHYPDRSGGVEGWARGFLRGPAMDTLELLSAINEGIHQGFRYASREAEGTNPPSVTLASGEGSCRDFALLMMEALRSLGIGARFVSGYLYDPALDDGVGLTGAGRTHAWVEAYLPGAGWVEYDPTNGVIDADALIRVAVTRDPAQAVPVGGSFTGAPGDALGMTATVTVERRNPAVAG